MSNVVVADGQEDWNLLHKAAPLRRPTFSTVQSLRARTAFCRHSLTHPLPCTRAHSSKKRNKEQNAQLTKHDAFVYWSSSCPICWWETARKLDTGSTSEDFSPTTVLTENISRCVQQIFQHRPPTILFLTNSTTTFSCLASLAPQPDSW